jgi:DNA-binding CsgD family transcriptional regulator
MAAGKGFSRQGAEPSGRSWTAEGNGAGGGGAGTDAADGGAQVQLVGSPAKTRRLARRRPPCDGTSLDELPARRIARAVAALRSRYGSDPLFCDILDEAETLAFTMVAEDRRANRAAPTAGRNDLTPREHRLGMDGLTTEQRLRQVVAETRDHITGALSVLEEEVESATLVVVDTMVSAPATLEGLGQLTPREREVAQMLAEDRSDREIASVLGVTLQTAHSHTKAVLAKLELRSRHEFRHLRQVLPQMVTSSGTRHPPLGDALSREDG